MSAQHKQQAADLVASRRPHGGTGPHQRAPDDGDERSALEPGVAAHELLRRQVDGQQAVLQRPKEGRDESQGDDDDPHPVEAVLIERRGRGQHDEGLECLQRADQRVARPDVRDVARPPRDKDKRKDEEAADQVDGIGRVPAVGAGQPERRQEHERVLEDVVAERTDELGDEQRQKASRKEHFHAGRFPGLASAGACGPP